MWVSGSRAPCIPNLGSHWSDSYPCCFMLLDRVWKNSMPKFREVIGGTETYVYCQTTICRKSILVVPLLIKIGVNKFGNKKKKH
jgi:hypothetical protein